MSHRTYSIVPLPSALTAAALLSASLLSASPNTNTNTNTSTTNTAAPLDDLGTITVTAADRVSTPLRDTTSNVTVISSREIRQRGYQNVAEVLSRVSGFAAASTGGPGQPAGVFLRGMSRGNLLVMIDGIPMKDPNDTDFSYALEHLRLDNVERIEIVKGAQSGLWGSDAVAGVVNIVTKTALPGAHVSLRGGVGSYDTRTGGMTLSAAGDAGSFLLNGDHFETGGFSALSPRDAEHDRYTNDSLDLKGRITLSPHASVGVFHHRIDGKFDYDSNANPNDFRSRGTFENRLTGMDYRYDNGVLTLHGIVSDNAVDRHYDDAVWGPFDTDGDTARASLSGSYLLDNSQRISGGVEINSYRGSNRSLWGANSADYDNRAVFGSYRYIWENLLNARTIFNATLRYDDFNAFKNKTTYRFGLKRECRLLPGFFTAANLYSAYRAPSVYEATSPLPGTTLKPEYTRGYELTVGYGSYLSLTYFRNRISDEIRNAGGWPPRYVNDARSYTISGLELGSEWSPDFLPLTLSANYTHLFDTKDRNGNPLYRRPQNSFNFFLDYRWTPEIRFGVNLRYVGKRTDQQWVGWVARDVVLDNYTVVNLNYNHRIGENLNLSLQARNIFDEEYETSAGYSTEGRSVYGTVEYRF